MTSCGRRFAIWSLAGAWLGAAAGCGYSTRGLYPADMSTVSVPIFKNTTMRRDVEFILTEKVIQKIESRTPFKVVASGNADTEITGTITGLNKSPFGEDSYDNPRGGVMIFALSVCWTDKRTGKVLNEAKRTFDLRSFDTYTIDLAQSQATAINDICNRMADHVVSMMQSPW